MGEVSWQCVFRFFGVCFSTANPALAARWEGWRCTTGLLHGNDRALLHKPDTALHGATSTALGTRRHVPCPHCHTPEGATSEETREHLCTSTAIAFVIILTIPTELGSNTEKELLKLYLSTYFSYFFTLFGLDQLKAFHWQCARRRGQELTICWRKIPFPPKKEICWCYLLRQTHIWPSQSWGIAYGIGKKKKKEILWKQTCKGTARGHAERTALGLSEN